MITIGFNPFIISVDYSFGPGWPWRPHESKTCLPLAFKTMTSVYPWDQIHCLTQITSWHKLLDTVICGVCGTQYQDHVRNMCDPSFDLPLLPCQSFTLHRPSWNLILKLCSASLGYWPRPSMEAGKLPSYQLMGTPISSTRVHPMHYAASHVNRDFGNSQK